MQLRIEKDKIFKQGHITKKNDKNKDKIKSCVKVRKLQRKTHDTGKCKQVQWK